MPCRGRERNEESIEPFYDDWMKAFIDRWGSQAMEKYFGLDDRFNKEHRETREDQPKSDGSFIERRSKTDSHTYLCAFLALSSGDPFGIPSIVEFARRETRGDSSSGVFFIFTKPTIFAHKVIIVQRFVRQLSSSPTSSTMLLMPVAPIYR